MPRGAAVIRYEGARGVSWRVKYPDADGRQVKETLGREPEWDRRKAERALGARLADVDKGMRKPKRRTFDDLADEFEAVALAARPRKKSTVVDYKATLRNHLRPAFGDLDLGRLSQSPEAFERYAAGKIADGLSPKTVRNHLVLAGLMFRTARRWRWVSRRTRSTSSTAAVPDGETETVDAATIADLIAAYRVLEADARTSERFWFESARRMTVVALSTGLRRGELLGLRGRTCELLERRLSVVQQFVRNEMTTPKSRAGRRAFGLGPVAVEALEEQWQAIAAPGARVDRVLAPGARHAARPVEAVDVRAEGAPGGRGAGRRSGRGTGCVTRRSPRRPRRGCRGCSCRRRPVTRTGRRRSGTCTRTRRATRTPPSSPRRAFRRG